VDLSLLLRSLSGFILFYQTDTKFLTLSSKI